MKLSDFPVLVDFPVTVRRTAGLGATFEPITLLLPPNSPYAGGVFSMTASASANWNNAGVGGVALVRGTPVTPPGVVSIGIVTAPQLDQEGTVTFTFTPTGGAPIVVTRQIFYRNIPYETVPPAAAGNYRSNGLYDAWVKVHPGGAFGELQCKGSAIEVCFQSPTADAPTFTLNPGDSVSINTTTPGVWIRGSAEGNPTRPSWKTGLYQTNPPYVVVSK